jgi:hypothetical protein
MNLNVASLISITYMQMEPFFTRTNCSGRTGKWMIQEERGKESSYHETILLFTYSLSMVKRLRSLCFLRIGTGSSDNSKHQGGWYSIEFAYQAFAKTKDNNKG